MKISLILMIINLYGFKAKLLSPDLVDEKWNDYKVLYKKQYSDSAEEALRKQLFATSLQQMEDHNSKLDKDDLIFFTIGINHLSDSTKEEIHKYTHGVIKPTSPSANEIFVPLNLNKLPDSVDWRDEGVVGPPKHQGHCSSCWAFSAIGSLESHYGIYKRLNVSLSEQQLVDCVLRDANNWGCGGGWVDHAFEYIKANGSTTEGDYPYKAKNGECRYDSNKPHYTVTSYVDIEKGNELALQSAVAEKGPVSVIIDATGELFHKYKSGVYVNNDCSPNRPTHAVVVVGYGNEKGKDYWLVKNSYGPTWGDHGYIKIARNQKNHCGIASYASFPIV